MTKKKSPLSDAEELAFAELREVEKQEIRDARERSLAKQPVVEAEEITAAPDLELPEPPFDWEKFHKRTFRLEGK
jgi:hypothetical protein